MTNRRNLIIFTLIVTCGCCGSVFAQSKTRKSKSWSSRSSQSSLESRIEKALNADYGGTVYVEDLVMDRSESVGKVIKLKYDSLYIHFDGTSTSFYANIYDSAANRLKLVLNFSEDRDAREWAVDQGEGYGNSGSLYVYVEKRSLLALGERQRKKKGICSYSW